MRRNSEVYFSNHRNNNSRSAKIWPGFRKNGRIALRIIFLTLASIPFIFPFWWMFTSAFKGMNEIMGPLSLLPKTWKYQNFFDIFTNFPFARQCFNSIYIAILVTIGTLVVSSLAGYGFARIKFRGNSALFLMLLSAMMMPIEVTIIPNFFLFKSLGLTNTHIPLIILPILGSNGVFAVFMMRQFFLDIPKELEEAGFLDGLSRWGVFWRIALPLARPALGAVATISFLFTWNSFLEPLIFIDNVELYTIPVALTSFTDSYGIPLINLKLAAATISVLPILLVYLLAQKQIQKTMAFSGIK